LIKITKLTAYKIQIEITNFICKILFLGIESYCSHNVPLSFHIINLIMNNKLLLLFAFLMSNLSVFPQTKNISNSNLNSIPKKYWSMDIEKLVIKGNPIKGSEIVLFNLTQPNTTIIYSGINNKVDTLSVFVMENSSTSELKKALENNNLGTIVKLANYYHSIKQPYLVIELYKLTDSINIDYKTRIKVLNSMYQNGQSYAANYIADMIVKDSSIHDINTIHDIAVYFDKKELYSQSVKMYKKIAWDKNLKNTAQSLYSFYSIADLLEKNEKTDTTLRLYQIYEEICFATPRDQVALMLVEQGCKKCWEQTLTEIPYLDSLHKEYAMQKEKRIKAGATTRTVGSIVSLGSSIASTFIPGVGGEISNLVGTAVGSTTDLAGSILDDTRKLDWKMRLIDNQIARVNNRAKSIMAKVEIDKESIEKYNQITKQFEIDTDIPYVQIPTKFDTIFDIRDKNIYRTIKIGDTWWMLDDLMFKTDHSKKTKLNKKMKGAGYVHDFTEYSIRDAKDACPMGWTLPDSTDWNKLQENLGGRKYAYNYMSIGGLVDFNFYDISYCKYICNNSIEYTFTKDDESYFYRSNSEKKRWEKEGLYEGATINPTLQFYYNAKYFYSPKPNYIYIPYEEESFSGYKTGLTIANKTKYLPSNLKWKIIHYSAVRCIRRDK
jgi:uncharacterized protein (TIGR02145 family)